MAAVQLVPLLARQWSQERARHTRGISSQPFRSLASDVTTIACGGGCFLNAILARGLRARLAMRGITMLEAREVPPNDGGLSLGQAWVAMQPANRGR